MAHPNRPARAALLADPGDREAVANYAEELCGDLASMVRRHGLDTLGYLLEMAQLEAKNVSRGPKRG